MPTQHIKQIISRLKGPDLTLVQNPDQEKAQMLFFEGRYKEGLKIIDNSNKELEFSELEQTQLMILKSNILNEMGEKQKGFELTIQALHKSEELDHPILKIESLRAQINSLFLLGNLDQCQQVITESELLLKKSRRLSRNYKKKYQAIIQHFNGKILRKKGDLTKADSFLNKSYTILKVLGNQYELATLFNDLGINNAMKGESDLALENFKKSLQLYEELKNASSSIKLYNNIGQILWQKGELEEALGHYLRGQELSEKSGQKRFSAALLINIGLINEGKGDLDLALDNFQQSLKIFKELNRSDEIAICQNNMGRVYQAKGELDIALGYYEKSLAYFEEIENKYEMAASYHNIGLIYREKGDYLETSTQLSKTLIIQEELGNSLEISITLMSMIENFILSGAKDSVEHYLAKLKELRGENKVIEQRYQIAKAQVLIMSGRVVHRAEAQQILTNIAQSEIFDHELTVEAMFKLFELLLFELQTSGNEEVLGEVKELSQRIISIAESQKSFSDLAEIYRLQSKLALLELDVKESQRLLSQAQIIAETKGLQRLAQSISNEYDSLLNDLTKWDDFIERNASITERYELAELESMMTAILERKGTQYDDLPEEDPLMVLILDEAGLCLFSKTFPSESFLQDQLIGGLLTSINAFMQEAFSLHGSIERIKHEENTLLLKSVDPYMFAYVFQGQSYSAMQKLEKFITVVQESSLWAEVAKIRSTGRSNKVNDALNQEIANVFL
ncbi:MAG: tetratricopeptide repeat protein [Candidatus Hodarchaeales archaeon]